jgi:hypothetical protein
MSQHDLTKLRLLQDVATHLDALTERGIEVAACFMAGTLVAKDDATRAAMASFIEELTGEKSA